MSISLTLTADTLEELQQKAIVALGLGTKPTVQHPAPREPVAEPKRPVGRPRKVQPEPVAGSFEEPVAEEPDVPEIRPEDEPTTLEKMNQSYEPNGSAPDPIALEKLKQETVAKLPDMFAAGKVNLMRAVLTKYGKGAKSFPEIEAKDFPEIAAALARGDGS